MLSLQVILIMLNLNYLEKIKDTKIFKLKEVNRLFHVLLREKKFIIRAYILPNLVQKLFIVYKVSISPLVGLCFLLMSHISLCRLKNFQGPS